MFTTKVLIGDTIFTSPNGYRTAILHDHLNHVKVSQFAGKSQYLHSSIILRPRVLIQATEKKPQTPALQSSALMTELILLQLSLHQWNNPKILVLSPNPSTLPCFLKSLLIYPQISSKSTVKFLIPRITNHGLKSCPWKWNYPAINKSHISAKKTGFTSFSTPCF